MALSLRRVTMALAGAIAAVAGVGASAPEARAADLVVGVYASDPGACADRRVLSRISRNFDYQVRHVPHLPLVSIVDFYRIGETRYLPAHEDSPIERRYCHGDVILSDGRSRDIWYLIENPMGFAGIGSNVEFCVAGFDRWRVYNGNCRVLR